LFYCKIWDNDTLVRDFIPVVDSGGVACLYDKIDKKIYLNIGTGAFMAGNVVVGETPIQEETAKAREAAKIYVGKNGVARECWNKYFYESLSAFDRELNSSCQPMVTNTTDYVLIGGGYSTSNATTYAIVNAYDINGVKTTCTDLPATVRDGQTMTCAGYGIMAGGHYNSNQRKSKNKLYRI